MDKKDFYKRLVHRYKNGLATDEELEAFMHLAERGELDPYLIDLMNEQLHLEKSTETSPLIIFFKSYKLYAAAVIVLVILGGGYMAFSSYFHFAKQEITSLMEDVEAAKNQAVLTLADGRKVSLNTAVEASLLAQHGVKISNDGKGKLTYDASGSEASSLRSYNEIAVPRGGKFQLTLPDGTKVWLNADSKLKYPIQFSKERREVELIGEAYFEVNNKKTKQESPIVPFIVHTSQQNIFVLGTDFNVKAYQNEKQEATTLVNGRVRIGRNLTQTSKLLAPGQQSVTTQQTPEIHIKDADIEEVLGWKTGDFVFNETPLQEIASQLARWYNVEVEMEGVANYTYNGYIPRHVSLSKVLKMMELTGELKFNIKNRKIYITK